MSGEPARAFVVVVLNPDGEVFATYQGFDSLAQAQAYAAHNVRRQDRYLTAVIYARLGIASPKGAPDVEFTEAPPPALSAPKPETKG